MKMLDLRADAGNRDRATDRVTEFFQALAKGDWEGASTSCVDPLVILGQLVTRSKFALGDGKAFGPVFEVHVLPSEVLERFEDETAKEVFGQVLAPTDAVLFATVPLEGADGGNLATYGIIMDLKKSSEPLIKSLFDPSRFKTLSEWLMAEVEDKAE